jgi:hypothetical protein
MRNMAGVLYEKGSAYPSYGHGCIPGFGEVCVDNRLIFLCSCFDCPPSVYYTWYYPFLWIVHS